MHVATFELSYLMLFLNASEETSAGSSSHKTSAAALEQVVGEEKSIGTW